MPQQLTADQRLPISARGRRLIGGELERCIYCNGKKISREGRRYKKHETVQLWYCRTCDRVFTAQRAKGKHYPLKVILESLMTYYRGETRERTSARIKERFGLAVPARTLSTWIAQHRELTPYARLRDKFTATYRSHRIIRAVRLHHQQVYEYRIHQAKLDWALSLPAQAHLEPLRKFLVDMIEACPHHLFQTDARASQAKLPTISLRWKSNLIATSLVARPTWCSRQSPSTSAATMRSSASCSRPIR